MSKSLLRNTSSAPITLPPPYTGIIAPGDAVVLDDPPAVVVEAIGIIPELVNFLVVTQVPDAQPVDGHDRGAAAEGIARALASLTEPLDLNGQKIVDVADPTDPQDVATKAYVDTHGGGGGGGGTVTNVTSTNAYLTVANGTTTPALTVNVGSGASDVAAGSDARFNAAPSTAGAVVYDTGIGYSKTPAGTTGKVLKVGAGGIPEWADDSTTPTGAAGGSLAGTYPNPTIAAGAITNTEISASAAIATSKLSGALTDVVGNGLASFVNDATKVARTLYVSVDGAVGADGSLAAPFATITEALTAADSEPVGAFVQIVVGPGDFTENVNITRYNTLLIGSGGRVETKATKITGAITVNPFSATNKTAHTVYLTGLFVNPPSASSDPALKITGSGLFQFVATDCYFTTISTAAGANAVYSNVSHVSRPRVFLQDCIISTQANGPTSIVLLERGDCRIFRSQVGHGSTVTLGNASNVIVTQNDATLWMDSDIVESRGSLAAVNSQGAFGEVKLIVSNSSIVSPVANANAHAIAVGANASGLSAYVYKTALDVGAALASAIYGITAPAVVVFADITFQPNSVSTITNVTLVPLEEKHGIINLPTLTASLPLKLDANKSVTASPIALGGAEVSGTLPVGKGGTGIPTTPPNGAVVYGNGTTQAYTTVGTSGQPLLSSGAGAPAFGALNLGVAANITGALPSSNQAAQNLAGDLSGTTATAVVTALRGNPVKAGTLGAGDAGKVLTWSGSEYEPATITPGGGGGGGGGGLTYYLNYGVAAQAPIPNGSDKELALTFYSTAANTPAVTAPNSGVYATLAEFVSPIGQPGVTTTPPGLWDVGAYLLASHIDGVFFRAVVYKWNGTTLSAPIATSQNVELTAAGPGPELFNAAFFVPQTSFAINERLVIRLEITRTIAAAHTVTGYFGNGYPSHAHTTLGAPGGTGLVKVVDGIIQAPASLLVNADVATDAAIVVSKLDGNAGGGASNKVLHGSNDPAGPAVWGAVALGSDVSGQLPVPNGGTGLYDGTSGGVLYFNSSSTMATSAELSANALVLGGGAGVAPSTPLGLGTSGQVLHGNASGAPTWGAVDLASEVSGTLPIDKGGTGTNTAPVAGGIIYGSSTTALASSAAGTLGQLLQSSGAGAPTWVSTLGITQGGTGTATTSANQIPYGNSTATALTYTSGGSPGEVLGIGALGTPEWMSNGASPTGPAGAGGVGDLTGNYPNPSVAKINGTSVPAGGALTVGTVLRATGVAAAEWGALDLGNSSAVTGTLAKANVPAETVYTDGSYADPAWITSLSGTKVTGNISGNAANVTGIVAKANQEAQDLAGDLSGTTAAASVIKLRGSDVSPVTPTAAGQVLTWNGTAYAPIAIPAGGSGGSGVTYYFNQNLSATGTNLPADTFRLLREAQAASSTLSNINVSVGTWDRIGGFVTDAGDPNISTLPSGVWDLNFWADSDATLGTMKARFVLYAYDNSNNPESGVAIATSSEVEVYNQAGNAQYIASLTIPAGISLAGNKRLYIKLEAQATVPNKYVSFGYGDTAPTHTHTTVPSVTGTGIVKVINSAFAPQGAPVDLTSTAEVAGVLPIANGGTGAATLTLSDANKVFASPDAAAGAPGFRALVADDLPTLPSSKISGIPYDLAGEYAGPVGSGAEVFHFRAVRPFTIKATPSSSAWCLTQPSANTTFTIYRYTALGGSPDTIGTMVFSNGSFEGVVTIGGGTSDISVLVNERIVIAADSTPNGIESPFWTLYAVTP